MRIFVLTILFLGIIVAGAYFLWPKNPKPIVTDFESCVAAGYSILESFPEQCRTKDGSIFIKTPPKTEEPSGPIVVKNVSENQLLESPFIVRGEARGNWYFEASFPIKLIDSKGKTLVETYATAQGDWMTTDFVPFISQELVFTATTPTGTLILHNDNPSGLKENDREIRIPVRFQEAQKAIKLYYYNSAKDKDGSGNIVCSAKGLVAVNRSIPVSITPIQDAIRLLLAGEVTAEETKAGIISNFPLAGVELEGASVVNGTLTLTFTDPQHSTGGGACRINVLRAQIEATAKQFSEVKAVRILPATIFQP